MRPDRETAAGHRDCGVNPLSRSPGAVSRTETSASLLIQRVGVRAPNGLADPFVAAVDVPLAQFGGQAARLDLIEDALLADHELERGISVTQAVRVAPQHLYQRESDLIGAAQPDDHHGALRRAAHDGQLMLE